MDEKVELQTPLAFARKHLESSAIYGAERKKNSMLSCSTGANGRFVPSLVFIEIGARRSPSRFPVDAVGILSGTTPGWDK
ncbi:hypothetical protein V6N13_035065 [Hibiscus sabdariffa]